MSQIIVPASDANIPSDVARIFQGNTGSGSPVAGIEKVVTANSTPIFNSSGNTITLDFGLTNIVLGSSLPSVTSGSANVGLGLLSLNGITSGNDNTAVGFGAGESINSGMNNTLIGLGAGSLITTTNGNTIIGSAAMDIGTGTNNTVMGFQALTNLSGSGSTNISIGVSSGFSYTSTESQNIVIGNQGVLGENNTTRIGSQLVSTAGQNRCFIAGITGVTVSNAAIVTINTSTGQLGTTSASSLVSSITGTANQVLANGTSGSAQTGAITLTLPQSIATNSTPTFTGILAANGTSGAPSYSFTSSTNSGVFTDTTNLYLEGNGSVSGSFGFNVSISGNTTTITQGVVYTGMSTSTSGFTTGYNQYLYLVDTVTAAAPVTVQLVNSPITGQVTVIKDSSGAANTFNITISGVTSGKTIDGATTLVINIAYGVARLIYNGTQYNQI